MARFSLLNPYRYSYSDSTTGIKYAALLFVLSIVVGTIAFIFIENYNLGEAFYMAVITIATVGYQEVRPLSDAGRWFASIYIILNIGIFAYSITAFTSFVVQGEIFKTMHLNYIEKKISQLKDHVIICGFGRYGAEITHHFLKHHIPFVIIEREREKIEHIQSIEEKLLYVEEDATHDEALLKAGIHRARAIISALPDDTDNLFTVLTARQMNKTINIISRANNARTEKKLRLAGANHVIMPDQIGGFYIASLVTKPGAVEFFSFITDEYESDIHFEILKYDDMPAICQDKSIRELRLRKETGANVIGFRTKEGKYLINPDPDICLEKGTSFIVLGSNAQLQALRNYLRQYKKEL